MSKILLVSMFFLCGVVLEATEIVRISTVPHPTTTSFIITTIGDIGKYDYYLDRERCEFKVILYRCTTKPIDESVVLGALLRVRAMQINDDAQLTVSLLHEVDYQVRRIGKNMLEVVFENPYAPYLVERVLFRETEDYTELTILTTKKPRYKYFHLLSPPRIFVDFIHGTVTSQILTVKSTRVKNIELRSHKINAVTFARVIINLEKYYHYAVKEQVNKLIVSLYEKLPPKEVKPPEVKPPEVKPPEVKPPEKVELPPKVDVPIKPEKEILPAQQQEYISLDIKDADLVDVLRLIGYKANINIVPYKGVSGVISVKLKNIHWREALDVILKSQGFDYLIEDNIVKVGTPEQLKIETTTKIYTFNYALACKMAEIISKMLTERVGYVQVDPRTNSVIITDTPKTIERISAMIKQLDTRLPQVMIEAKLVSLSEGAEKELGIRWLYKKRAPIPLEIGGTPTAPPSLPFPYEGVDVFAMGEAMWFGYAKLKDSYALYAALNALLREGKGEVLSNPKIITVHNKEAMVLSGEEVPVLSVERTGAGEFYRVTFRKVGVSLTVLPRIQPDKTVLLQIRPEVSSVAEWRVIREGEVPVIKTDHAETEVLLEDGETVVIGGIIKTSESVTEKRVPLLSDLPLFGHLFRQKMTKRGRSEFLILLTPKILTE